MSGLRRRVRAYAGQLALLAVLAFVAALLIAGLPRLANEHTDRGLREDVARLPHTVRDLTFVTRGIGFAEEGYGADRLPGPLPRLVTQQWVTNRVGPTRVRTTGTEAPYNRRCPPNLSIRTVTGADRAVRIVEGRAPATRGSVQEPAAGGTVEAIVSRTAAEAVGIRLGSTFQLAGSTFVPGGDLAPATVHVVGVYQELDPAAPRWDDMRLTPVSCPSPGDGNTVRASLLTDDIGIRVAGVTTAEPVGEWRYRIDERLLTAADVPALTAAVAAARRTPPIPDTALTGSLESTLEAFQHEQTAVAALLAIVRAGLLATLLGLVALAAGLVTQRRRAEFALIRARGGAAVSVGGRVLAETALAAPAAVALGGFAGTLLPGRPGPHTPAALILVGLVTTLATPVRAALAQRRPAFTARRDDLVRRRTPARLLVAQGFLVLLAVLGVLLVRQRGLAPAAGVDPYLVLVPVLLALAAAVLALHAVPWPLRRAAALAARARGAVPFLGLAGAGRAGISAAPVAVLVVAIATGVFTGVVTGTVDEARDRATDLQVAGDARITGAGFAASTVERLAAVPGVSAAAGVLTTTAALRTLSEEVRLAVVDGPAADRVLRLSGSSLRLDPALARPGRVDGPVPAVVSPDLAPRLREGGEIEVLGVTYRFRVAAVATEAPGLPAGAQRFVVLPAQALPASAYAPILPNQLLVAGPEADPAALRTVAGAGQREYLAGPTGRPPPDWAMPPATVVTWAQQRATYQDSGVNRVLTFTFTAGAAGAVVLALLAVGFAVLAGSPARAAVLARLRTLGLSGGQGRRLLVYEVVPLLGVAVLAGGAVGVALPPLVGPALGLSGFTAGVQARIHIDPLLVAAVLGVVLVAVVAALLVEAAASSRARLREEA